MIRHDRLASEGSPRCRKTLTAACVLLAVANFLTLAAEARTDDPPPAKQESSKSKGDATATAQRKSSKSQAGDIPPAEQKSSNSKDDVTTAGRPERHKDKHR